MKHRAPQPWSRRPGTLAAAVALAAGAGCGRRGGQRGQRGAPARPGAGGCRGRPGGGPGPDGERAEPGPAGGPTGHLQLPRAHSAARAAGADPPGRGGGGHLLHQEHRQQRSPGRGRAGLQQANDAPANPVHEPLLLMTDQEGGRVRRLPGPPALSEEQIGQSAAPARQARLAGTGAAATLHRGGPRRQPGPGARRVPVAGRVHRRLRARLQQRSGVGGPARRGVHHGAAGRGRARRGEALPRTRHGDPEPEHRQPPGDPEPAGRTLRAGSTRPTGRRSRPG